MFAFMMVVGMGTKVNAETTEGPQVGTTGKIIVSNPAEGHTYKLYKILNLESYSYETGKANEGNYSYTLVGNEWDTFVENNAGADNFFTISGNYVTFNEGDAADLAKAAIEFAKGKKLEIQTTPTKDSDGNLVFSNLDLGYYLVDSSVGALCGLDTTNSEVTIQEKNEVPTVDKKIFINKDLNQLNEKNTVDIGDTVIFQTTIEVKPGAQNYILHDVMDSYLKFAGIHGVYDNANEVNSNEKSNGYAINTDFVVQKDLGDGCTFELTFTDAFYNKAKDKIDSKKITKIYIQYLAEVGDNAPINTAMSNTTWLTYGDNNTKTNESTTETYTFGIPVFKYTGNNKPLAGAKFTLYTDESCADNKALKFTLNKTTNKYRYDATTNGSKILASLATGRVDIEGIKAGTYYLKEVEAPKGYNKLAAPIKVEIDNEGNVIVDKVKVEKVKVENKTGTLLPSTGGMGTTLIYMAGAILVIASGIVLVSKKKSKAK